MIRRSSREKSKCVSFDRVADTFERTRPIPSGALSRAYRRLLRSRRARSRLTILDVGIGTGRMIRPLLERPVTLIGVDVSLAMLSHLRRRYKAAPRRMELHMIRADASRLPFRDSAVQVVQSTHIIHLLRSWKAALVEWQRVVSNDGSLVLMWESGQRSSVRRAYERAARQRLTYREMRFAQVEGFLLKRGWRMRGWKIPWRQKAPFETTLRTLELRSYSRQWSLSNRNHAAGMSAARKYAARRRTKGLRSEILKRTLKVTVFS